MYKIATTDIMKELMGNYFRSLGNGDKKIAWCTSVGPAELLRSFGFEVYFPAPQDLPWILFRKQLNAVTQAMFVLIRHRILVLF